MLVLSRKKNQSIVIGDQESLGFEIKIVVVEIRGDKVRLGVEAPRQVPVHRSEVAAAILRSAQQQVAEHNQREGFTAPAVGSAHPTAQGQ